MNRSEFKSAVRSKFRQHVKGGSVEFVWTFVGRSKGASKERIVNGYFVHSKNGVSTLWLAQWSEKYGMEMRSQSLMHWKVLSKLDQKSIKGGLGDIPVPSVYGM